MRIAARLAGFALVVVLAFSGAYAVGAAVGPLEQTVDDPHAPPAAPASSGPTTRPDARVTSHEGHGG